MDSGISFTVVKALEEFTKIDQMLEEFFEHHFSLDDIEYKNSNVLSQLNVFRKTR